MRGTLSVMLLLMMSVAWADAFRVPGGQTAAAWKDALALTGLTLAEPMQDVVAELAVDGGQWMLRVETADGTWRTASVDAPTSTAQRESIARTVLLMRASRSSVEHPWTIPPMDLPPAPAPEPEPEARWVSPPPYPKAAPPLGEVVFSGAGPRLPVSEVFTYPASLQPEVAPLDTIRPFLSGGWVRIGAGGSIRPGTTGSGSLQAASGLLLRGGWCPGLEATWQSSSTLRDLQRDETVQSLSVQGVVWRTVRPARVPLDVGAGAGATWLTFRPAGEAMQPVLVPSAMLEVSAGGRVQVYGRAQAEVLQLVLIEVVDDVLRAESQLSPWTVRLGIRLTGVLEE